MRIVLAVLFVFLTIFLPSQADVQCGNDKFCRVGFRPFQPGPPNEFQVQRDMAKKLAVLASKRIIGIRRDFAEVQFLIQFQSELCRDDTIGFLLDKNVSNYQVTCVWTGSTQFGQCRPVPPIYMDKAFYYIKGEDWMKRLRMVRKAIGCNAHYEVFQFSNAINKNLYQNVTKKPVNTTLAHAFRYQFNVDQNYELFICNERCVQAGIGYVASLLLILLLAISFFKNCVDVQ